MLLTSLRPQETLRDVTILPSQWQWSNLVNFWTSGLAGNLMVTLQVAAGSTVLVLLVALPAAYYTARHNFRGRTAFLILVLITQMFQPTAMLVGIYREFSQLGLVDSIWSLILVNGGFNLAFAVWILHRLLRLDPARAGGGRLHRRQRPLRRAVPGSRCRSPCPASSPR